ncbi:MAG: hypothetical protein E7661_02335 [Ruminococcaceae bacterium]|nr:hypothetical protein [Oscillospiraceae bacterium]
MKMNFPKRAHLLTLVLTLALLVTMVLVSCNNEAGNTDVTTGELTTVVDATVAVTHPATDVPETTEPAEDTKAPAQDETVAGETVSDETVSDETIADETVVDGTVADETNPDNPEVPTAEPEIPTEEPEVPTEEPEIPTEEPEVPTEEPEIPTEEPETAPVEPEIPEDPAVVHVSQDEMYYGDIEFNKIEGTDIFAPGHYTDFNGVVNYSLGDYPYLIDWGWVALNTDDFKFGYIIDNGDPIINPDYTVAAGDDVKAVATQLGASNASRFKGALLVAWFTVGEHNVKFVIQIGDEIHTLREYTVVVTPHEHKFESVVTAPTCTEVGYTTYTCPCGETYRSDEVAATGHSYESVVTAPTCTEGGYTTYTCSCGDTYKGDEVAATGHSYETVVTAPTCTAGGYTTYTCSCGDTYKGDEVAAAGHNYVDGKCSVCGAFDPNKVFTVAEALALCGEEAGYVTSDRYYVRGIVQTVTNGQYGAMIIGDETGTISIYGMYGADGSVGYSQFEYKPVKGDEVLVHCILQNYNGTKEIKNARLIEYKNNQSDIDVSQYAPATITEARDAEKGANLKISGVVARITYATGMKPSGFILVDNGASIYVYDGDAAQRVAIGNRVEIAGTKDYWILDSEIEGANKFGYKGCNQLTDCILVSNDNQVSEIDFNGVTEMTVKELLNTPVTENITTQIFKVNALVKEVPGNGFTNYYFFDIDGETGNYTYSQCNGGDFEWLREFDGKICTVYITALNAKSTGTSCTFRFLPVAVIDEDYTFDTSKAPEYVLEYHVMDLFKTEYTGNPLMEVPTSVSSELLGFENATVSYVSSNEAAVKFNEQDVKLVMECLKSGTATVTVTVTYGEYTATESIKITVAVPEGMDAGTVQDAINAQLNDEVTVKGIVGPSLVNRNGFYLIDETGLIAVVVNDVSIFSEIEIGQEIVIKGKRDKFHNNQGGTHAGQTAITGATVEANYYGNHAYDDSNFVTDKTLADFHNLDVTVDYSTTVFVVKATVNFQETAYYTNCNLTDANGNKVTLYCSSGKQYGFLKQFAGQEVTLELAACNWNNKTFWAGCVLSVITEDGKVLNTLNFDNN